MRPLQLLGVACAGPRSKRNGRWTLFLVLGIVTPAAGTPVQDLSPTGPLRVERSLRGDTTVVRTLAGSSRGRARLVEEFRIGSVDGPVESQFGLIHCVAVLRDGSVAVFDGSVPALRLFDSAGRHVRTLGRDGAGPGEYRNQCLGLAVHPDGALMLYDPRNARLNRYAPDGSILPSWPAPAGLFAQHNLRVDSTGYTYVKVLLEQPQPGTEWKIGEARLDRTGSIRDTVPPPAIPGDTGEAIYAPRKHWAWTRSGARVSGYGGEYLLIVTMPGRRPVQIERVTPRIRLDPAERRNHQEVTDSRLRAPNVVRSGRSTTVPPVKPYFRDLLTDADERIWVQLHTPGQPFDPPPQPQRPGMPAVPLIRWRERPLFDVFQLDGTYLGQVTLPGQTWFREARGDRLWAMQMGEDGEQYIVRYRMEWE